MNIQSFSVVVPNVNCVNNCPFCVSRMVNSDIYPNLMSIDHPQYDKNVNEYLKRMKYVADSGCKTMILTGTSEPQQNRNFLASLALFHRLIGSPFTNIEMQCTGVMLNNNSSYLRFLRNFVGVNTIALSINSLNDDENNEIIGHSNDSLRVDLESLTYHLKEHDFNIRCCFNLNSCFESFGNTRASMKELFSYAKHHLHADQVTLRKFYSSDCDTVQNKWIREHDVSDNFMYMLNFLFLKDYKVIRRTEYGQDIIDVDGISVLYDSDCMGKHLVRNAVKYLILRPNCKLYSSWDSPASIVF